MKVCIYGLFLGGACLYIGATVDPRKRLAQHRSSKGKLRHLPNAIMRILRTTTDDNAQRLEIQIIRAYRRKGQASLNEGECAYRGVNPPVKLRIVESGAIKLAA